ncbi:serine/threonine-protein phosphatase PGAM5, mitochondrial isoform X2 [Nematostella vectensis]|uniref:serine/threonine-protein phosphatase PGAM5, mitochondrial isoform X2 n=1 Tax=Nematostella vectensis TaxID=45351 RepID=UPI0013901B7B|nr:serine/threonine-protein phosphatase PGAM5, mitochondrial isoform X2 [Nematostella vectensis]
MSSFRKISRIAVAVATVSGAYVAYNLQSPAFAAPSHDDLRGRLLTLFKPSNSSWDNNWDFCETGKRKLSSDGMLEEPDIKPTGKRHLIFIRHGQYMDREDEDDKKVLTELGRLQAEITGQRLKDLNHNYTKIIVSDMIRAEQTADKICKYLPNVPRETCSMLREGAPFPPDPPSSNWRPEQCFFRDSSRIEAAFRKHVHRADTTQVGDTVEIYVCHANVIRYIVCRALQFPPEGWLRMSIGHCGMTWVTVRPNGRVSLRSLGDTGHLQPEKMTM